MDTVAERVRRAQVRGEPAPLSGGPLALLRFMRAHRMLTFGYFRLIVRWARLKLRWRGRLQTDGLCFIGPGVTFEIGKGARVKLGRWCWIGHGSKIRAHEGEVEIGAKTVMGQECTISAFQHVSVGRECIIADRVMLIDFDHGVVEVERPIRDPGHLQARRPRRQQLLDRLRRLRAARRHRRRQLRDRHELRRDQGPAAQLGRRRPARPRAADAGRAGEAPLA